MEDWKETPLSEITSLITKGTTPSMIGASFTESGIKYIKSESILDNSRILDSSKFAFISLETHDRLKRSQIEENDLLFSMAGMFLGKTAIVTKNDIPANTNQAVAIIRIIPNKADFKFIYYYLNQKNIVKYINNLSGQSAQPNINLQQIGSLNINLPPLPTQQKIAQILSSLDDKIELNNKINANLEQQAQALFKSWFVDNVDKYPKMSLESVVTKANVGGDAIKKTPIVEEDTGIKCIRIGDLTNNRPINEWGFTKVTDNNFKRYQLHKNDIVLARTAVLGLNKIIFEDLNAVYNNGMIRLEANINKILPFYLYCHMNTDDYKNYMNRIVAETSVRPNMKSNYLLDYNLIVPDLEIQRQFENVAVSIFNEINKNEKENRKLSNLRDTLLPKLMNGEIEV